MTAQPIVSRLRMGHGSSDGKTHTTVADALCAVAIVFSNGDGCLQAVQHPPHDITMAGPKLWRDAH